MPLDSTTNNGHIGGREYWDEDVEEHFLPDGRSTATRTITCAWDDRIAIAVALSGGTTAVGIIETNVPASKYPDAQQLIVQGIHPVGVGKRKVGVNGMVGYDFARMRIEYGLTDRDLGQTNDLGGMSMDISNEILSPPRDRPTFGWLSDGVEIPPEATPGIPISTATFERVRRNVATLPVSLVISLLDHLNDATFEGAPRGHVIYKGCRTFRKVTNLGFQNWDISHCFVYRTKHWNKFLRPRAAGADNWEEIRYLKVAGTPGITDRPLFDYGNLAGLYQ